MLKQRCNDKARGLEYDISAISYEVMDPPERTDERIL